MYLAKPSLACFKIVSPNLSLNSAIRLANPTMSIPLDGFGFSVVIVSLSNQSKVVSFLSTIAGSVGLDSVDVDVDVGSVVVVDEESGACFSAFSGDDVLLLVELL